MSAAVTWHPFDRNRVSYDIWQAQDIKNYKFYGISAHASRHPEMGRSALDAAELMLAAMPEADDGNQMYGTVLNAGSDTSYWACMNCWYQFQGYEVTELPYLLEANMAEGTVSSILSTDSKY